MTRIAKSRLSCICNRADLVKELPLVMRGYQVTYGSAFRLPADFIDAM